VTRSELTYTGERAWRAIGDRLQAPRYLSMVQHYWKNQGQKTKNNIRKYSFVNRSFTDRNKVLVRAVGISHGKTYIYKTRVRKVKINEVK